MSKAHYDAVEAMLPPGVRVFRGSAPIEPKPEEYPYVVLGGTPGKETTEALGGPPDSMDIRFKLTYAGLTFDAVLILLRKVRPALNRKRPALTGWQFDPLEHDSLVDIRTDFAITVPGLNLNPVYAVDEFRSFSTR